MCEDPDCPGCTCTEAKPYCFHCVMTYLATLKESRSE
jgi:hypothetical protein